MHFMLSESVVRVGSCDVHAGMTTLTDLDLGGDHSDISDAGLDELRGLPLKRLSLSYCHKVTNAGLFEIRGAPLEDLYLLRCELISDEGVSALIAGKPLSKLELHGCRITKAIVPILFGLPLVKLTLPAWHFSTYARAELKQAFPSIRELRFSMVMVIPQIPLEEADDDDDDFE